ncbi:MAG: putative DNA binding domain-containing protein [Desulfovibrio sp.]|jgi:ATP-dependent DNA helicase RecG|nr:putative DNA binding domain-containing protein [Desulfovibrio sp.]
MTENETIEYKKTLGQLKEGIISIAAILNKHGEGELWFGIRDDGVSVGINVGDKTIRDISQAIAAHIEPKIYPELATITRQDTQCIRVRFSGIDKPYFAYGRAYIRVGDEDRQLSAKELENIFRDKNQDALRWDNKSGNTYMESLAKTKVRAFVKRANLTWDALPNALHKLDLLQDGKPVNTALAFFAKKPIVKMRCAVFASTTTSTILDQQDYEGCILELIEQGQAYILKNIHIGMRLEGLYRVDVPELAVPALREALINAFCHRDYYDPDEVRIAIFQDRVEIRNPGKLFGGLTIQRLREGNVSARRNPLIADMLRRIQMIEGWGRGMPLILDNEPKAQFQEVAHIFIASFPRPSFEPDYAAKAAAANRNPDITTTTTATDTTITTTTASTTILEAERAILAAIRHNQKITLAALADTLSMTKDGVRYHTDNLKNKGLLRRIGTYNGYWEIV